MKQGETSIKHLLIIIFYCFTLCNHNLYQITLKYNNNKFQNRLVDNFRLANTTFQFLHSKYVPTITTNSYIIYYYIYSHMRDELLVRNTNN